MEVIHYNDIGFSVVVEPDTYHVKYTVYDHEAYDMEDNPMFTRAGSTSGPDPVETIEEAEPYLHGEVKWDSCSNWYFDEQDRVMLHGCTKKDITRYGDILGRCFDLTKDRIPDKWLDY